MLFYFVRHGQTEANRLQVLAGSGMDHPLNEEGHAQAKRLAMALKSLVPHPVHRLLVSNMTRTRETAQYLAQALALPMEIIPDLREWHLGEWEGKTFLEFGHHLLGDGEPTKGEARKIFYSRVEGAWRQNHCDKNPYVIVSHGGVWLALQDILKIPRFKINNCDLIRVSVEKEQWCAQTLILKAESA